MICAVSFAVSMVVIALICAGIRRRFVVLNHKMDDLTGDIRAIEQSSVSNVEQAGGLNENIRKYRYAEAET